MTKRIAPALSAIALLTAMPAGAAVSDFRIEPQTPTPTPRVQGPVDPDVPVVRRTPAPTPAPTPVPSAVPAVTPTPSPRLTLPPATPSPRATARPSAATPAAAPTPAASAAVVPAPSDTATSSAALPTGLPPIALPAAPPAATPTPENEDGGLPWGWIAIGLGALALALGGGWALRRTLRHTLRPRRGTVLIVPDIEKPRVPPPAAPSPPPPVADPAPSPAAPEEPTHPLLIGITPIKLTQTFMNEALSYRLALTNVGKVPLSEIAVAADLVSAHASRSRQELLAGPHTELPRTQTIAGIAPGETVEATAEIRTPLAELQVIRQGAAVLVVPLARFRITAEGMEPRHFTLAVGQQVPGASTLAPIRLDLGPRTTDGLAGRAF